jgi:hypothetical protein
VYDCAFQEKAERRAERSRARRGTKRRGCRRGRRNARKCRRLVTADPGSDSRPNLQERLNARRAYLLSRREKHLARLRSSYRKFVVWRAKLDPLRSSQLKTIQRIKPLRLKCLRRLVDLMSRTSGDSPEFCLIKLKLYFQISTEGWESLPPLDTTDVQEAADHSGIPYESRANPSDADRGRYELLKNKEPREEAAEEGSEKVGITTRSSWLCPFCGCKVFKKRPVCQNWACGSSSAHYDELSIREYEELRDKNRREVAKARLPWGRPPPRRT